MVKHASATNGVFALVLGLIAWLYLEAVIVVLCAEVNVVRSRRLYPRALLTPFTDNVQLTGGDEQAHTSAAKAQRNKGFQHIDVSFHPDDSPVQPAPRRHRPGRNGRSTSTSRQVSGRQPAGAQPVPARRRLGRDSRAACRTTCRGLRVSHPAARVAGQ